MLKLILVLLIFFVATPVLAWQENVRIYQQCTSCHVSPSGGGVLTEYGKGLSTQFATLDKESFGPSNYSTFKSFKWLLLGGNIRNLYIKQYFDEFERERSFLMQADLELAMLLGDFTFVGMFGIYNVEFDKLAQQKEHPPTEHRRYYAKYQVNENMIVRLGKFFPKFGLMLDDHTEAIRTKSGYGQGNESRNVEIGFYSEFFNVVGTIAEQDDLSHKDVLTAEWLPGKSIVGVSLQSNEIDQMAIYYARPLTKYAYFLFESLIDKDDAIYFTKFGAQLFRGIVPYLKYSNDSRETYSYGTQLHFIPHLEFVLESSLSKGYADFTASSNYYF